ncbi:MAG: hypothetical protein BGO31_11535 [Bacteroidetes bacterium 43-16]|nr:MAG: hypothetical protein BGO31_11535 [Bacteroidetes bacterium 43-16]
MKKALLTFFALLLLTWSGKVYSQQVPDNTKGRLWGLCKVWGYMKYYHPNTCQVNWDSLIRENVTLVATATSNTDYNTYMINMLNYLGQITPQQATVPPPQDSNLNLQLDWIAQSNFSQSVQDFLETFKSRAGTNVALACRLQFNDYSDPNYISMVDFRDDIAHSNFNLTLLKDRLTFTFNYWNAFNYFGPYRNLTDTPWDTTLMHTIDDMIAANNTQSYLMAMAKMQSRINDSHGSFYGPVYDYYLGDGAAGIEFRWYEQKIVVYKIYTGQTGLAVGDELVAVDGIPIADIALRYRDRIAASNEAAFYRDFCPHLSRDILNTNKVLQLRNSAGQLYTLPVSYHLTYSDWYYWSKSKQSGPAWSTACNGYGYVDMDKLLLAECDQMYQELKTKPGIIFDCRNYPKGTMFNIAKYLFAEPIIAARYFIPDLSAPGRFTIGNDGQNLGTWNNPNPYPGKLYFIVNQETQSHAEYTVQYLSKAADATVIGTQTAGADGNVNLIMDPKLNYMYFTGLGWYDEDWYQCQRNGIKIDTIVAPTIQGLREGRDEMLEWITKCTTSIKDPATGIGPLQIMPNPAGVTLNIKFNSPNNSNIKITVIDLVGSVKITAEQKATPGENTYTLGLSKLAQGVYLLKVSSSDGSTRTVKFVKQ